MSCRTTGRIAAVIAVTLFAVAMPQSAAAQTAPAEGAAAKSPPSLIIFLADDLSYWDLSHFGQKEFFTPHVDRLAREGMVFTNGYSASPQCASARAGLLTGAHMGRARIRNNGAEVPPELHARPYLLEDDETIADVLRRAGYATGHVGKWHMGDPGTPGMPHLQGFDTTLSFDHNVKRPHLDQLYTYPDYLWLNGKKILLPENVGFRWDHPANRFDRDGRFLPGGVKDPTKARHGEDIYLEKALEFIAESRDKPFFLYYATPLTHAMWPNELRELMDKQSPWTLNQKKWAGQVTQMDRSLGAIVESLEKHGIAGNTIIIFMSDNGYTATSYAIPRPPRWQDDAVLRNKGPWNRGKFSVTHGGVIVPFIAWGPGRVAVGETNRAVVQYDLLRTFAELAGVTPQKPTDGVSLVPLLAGQAERYPMRPFLYWETGAVYTPTGQSVLLDEQFFAYREHPNKPIRLFDIFEDRGCVTDLAADHPALIERAQSLYVSQHSGDNPWYANLSRAMKESR